MRNYCGGPTWLPGVVSHFYGPITYSVQLNSGVVWRCHIDQLRSFVVPAASCEQEASSEEQFVPTNSPTKNLTETPNSQNFPWDISQASSQDRAGGTGAAGTAMAVPVFGDHLSFLNPFMGWVY